MLDEKRCTKADQPTANHSEVRLFANYLFRWSIAPVTFERSVFTNSWLSRWRTRKCCLPVTQRITERWPEQFPANQGLVSENSLHAESILHVSCSAGRNKQRFGLKPNLQQFNTGSEWHIDDTGIATTNTIKSGNCDNYNKSQLLPTDGTSRAAARSTYPCIPPGSLNRVPALAGVRAGM